MASSRLCKYHGRACEFPGQCLNRAPRKYEGDGHEERIDPERLTLGNVIRHVQKSGGRPAFSDNVIIGIYVSYSTRRPNQKKVDREHFLTLQEALTAASKDDYVYVVLTRPYLYASNVFGSIPNWLQGVERYEASGNQLIDSHKVVVMSTGEYACYMAKEPLHTWQVIVGNIGQVYDDLSEDGAKATFKAYVSMSKERSGRASGENVTLMCDGEPYEEYMGHNTQVDDG